MYDKGINNMVNEKRMKNMLSASIKISDINYEKTFQNIFPMIRENIKTTESDNLVLRFFKEAG